MWHINSLHFLELAAIELKNPAIILGFYDTIGELTVEQFCPLCKTQMGLLIHIVGVHKVVSLRISNSGKGHSLCFMQFARIEFRWLNTFPIIDPLQIIKILPHHPFDFLIRHMDQIGHNSQRDDWLGINSRLFGAIA